MKAKQVEYVLDSCEYVCELSPRDIKINLHPLGGNALPHTCITRSSRAVRQQAESRHPASLFGYRVYGSLDSRGNESGGVYVVHDLETHEVHTLKHVIRGADDIRMRRLIHEHSLGKYCGHSCLRSGGKLLRFRNTIRVSELGLLVPFIDGDRFDHWKPTSVCAFIDACVDISDGLRHMHSSDWIHGDVSARHIMVDDHGAAILIGGGGSVHAGEKRAPIEGPHETLRAPEVVRGESRTARTDIFGLGAAMYGQLVGPGLVQLSVRLANAEDLDLEFWHTRVKENLRKYCSVRSMRALVAACLDPNPRGRPLNAEVVGRELRSMRGVAAVRFDGRSVDDLAIAA